MSYSRFQFFTNKTSMGGLDTIEHKQLCLIKYYIFQKAVTRANWDKAIGSQKHNCRDTIPCFRAMNRVMY